MTEKAQMTSYAADAVRTLILYSSAGFDVAKVAVDFQFLIGSAPISSPAKILIARTGLRKG